MPYPLTTHRLLIAPLDETDIDAFVGYRQDPEVARWQGWSPSYSRADAVDLVARQPASELPSANEWLQLGVRSADSLVLLGDVAIHRTPDQPDTFEIGVTLARAHQRHGFATEALQRLLIFLFDEIGAHRVIARCDSRNEPVGALLRRVGLRHESRQVEAEFFKGEWTTLDLYAQLGREHAASATVEVVTATAEQSAREIDLTTKVVASFEGAPDARLKQLLQALTRHLHAFLREVRLTEEEWHSGIQFLTGVGNITDERRQEFVLLSDVLGASMQTVAINNAAYRNATEATVFGPFFVADAPEFERGGDIAAGAPGEPCWVEGMVTDTDGTPLPAADIEVWEADADGFYDVQYGDNRVAGRGHLVTDANGRYNFWAVTPTPYPIPHDGPVGAMLAAVGRSPMRASHLHFMVRAPEKRTLVTHIFVHGDELLDRDSVFGVKQSLIKEFVRFPASARTPDGRIVDGPWTRVQFDIVLAPDAV